MKLLGGEPLLHDESWLAIDKFSNSKNVQECELIFYNKWYSLSQRL